MNCWVGCRKMASLATITSHLMLWCYCSCPWLMLAFLLTRADCLSSLPFTSFACRVATGRGWWFSFFCCLVWLAFWRRTMLWFLHSLQLSSPLRIWQTSLLCHLHLLNSSPRTFARWRCWLATLRISSQAMRLVSRCVLVVLFWIAVSYSRACVCVCGCGVVLFLICSILAMWNGLCCQCCSVLRLLWVCCFSSSGLKFRPRCSLPKSTSGVGWNRFQMLMPALRCCWLQFCCWWLRIWWAFRSTSSRSRLLVWCCAKIWYWIIVIIEWRRRTRNQRRCLNNRKSTSTTTAKTTRNG